MGVRYCMYIIFLHMYFLQVAEASRKRHKSGSPSRQKVSLVDTLFEVSWIIEDVLSAEMMIYDSCFYKVPKQYCYAITEKHSYIT